LIVFGLDKKIQERDSFFHNANSAFKREMWEKIPFDEDVSNIEDRIWGERVISEGYKIIYEPNASVYHWHGIHQDLNVDRAKNIVKILESLNGIDSNNIHVKPEDLQIGVIIPIRGNTREIGNKTLLEYTVNIAKKSKYVNNIVVSTDTKDVFHFAESLGVDNVLMRPKELSEDYVNVFDVLAYTVDHMESKGVHFDIIVLLEEIYPFRDKDVIDKMIIELIHSGNNTIVAAIEELRGIWVQSDLENKQIELEESALIPNSLKEKIFFVSMPGLCCVTYPELARNNTIFNQNVGLHEIYNPISSLAVRNFTSLEWVQQISKIWENDK
jgi:CMP-N-acetylneuraminic acid synthetase